MSEDMINQIKVYLHDCTLQEQNKGAKGLIEEKLHIEKALLDGLFDSAPLAIILTDNKGSVIRVNAEFSRLFGYCSEEVLNRNIDELLRPENRIDKTRSVTENTDLHLKTGFETARRHKTGLLLPVEELTAPVHVNGHQVALYGLYRDIGKRKRAEETLQNESAKLSAMMMGMEEGLAFADKDDRIAEVNPYLLKLLKKSREEIIGKSLWELLPSRTAKKLKNIIAEFKKTASHEPLVVHRAFKGLETIFRFQPVYSDGGYIGFIFNLIDVTGPVKAKREAQTTVCGKYDDLPRSAGTQKGTGVGSPFARDKQPGHRRSGTSASGPQGNVGQLGISTHSRLECKGGSGRDEAGLEGRPNF